MKDIVRYAEWMLGAKKPHDLETRRWAKLAVYGVVPDTIIGSKKLADIKKKVIK